MNAKNSVDAATKINAIAWATAVAAGLSMLAMPAAGQAVYQCGSAYSQQPCEGGRTVSLADERTSSQRAQAQAAARRESAAADAMEKARVKDEARAETAERRAARATSIGASRYEPIDTTAQRYDGDPRLPRPDVFVARVPGKPGDKKTVAKAREKTHGPKPSGGAASSVHSTTKPITISPAGKVIRAQKPTEGSSR